MPRRGVFQDHSADQVDALICWALQESVGEALPGLDVRRRVREQAELLLLLRRVGIRRSSVLLRYVAVCLSRVDAYLATFEVYSSQMWGHPLSATDSGWERIWDQRGRAVRLIL